MNRSRLLPDYGHLLWPVLLGLAGVYLMLPQVRRSYATWGALATGAALVLGGIFVVRLRAAAAETILFYAFSGIALVGGVLLITQKNPVHAALSFALVVLSTCGLFLLQGAPFLMAATIIIYAGAIVVTFLFVIMLAQQGGISEADQRSREPFLASLAGFVLIGSLICVVHKNYHPAELDALLGKVQQVFEAKSVDEALHAAGDPKELIGDEDEGLLKFFRDDAAAIDNLDEALRHQTVHLEDLRTKALRVLEASAARGSLFPSDRMSLSPFSGARASEPIQFAADGKVRERLPAQNVAALGRSLFTDYLLPVEIAGVLLLVATIGAIAIAGRRGEVLR